MSENGVPKKDEGNVQLQRLNSQTKQFRVVSSTDDKVDYSLSQPSSVSLHETHVGTSSVNISSVGKQDDRLNEQVISPEEEDGDDAFFAKSFALNAEQNETEKLANSFVGGLRSLFESDDEGNNVSEIEHERNDCCSDAEAFQKELEQERQESIDGILRQGDVDFLSDAGKKYDSARTIEDAESQITDLEIDFSQAAQSGEGLVQHARIRPESILEAMLFVGNRENKPLPLKIACSLMRNVSELEAIEVLADLNERYYRDGAPYKIVRDRGGYRMVLRSEYSEFVSRFNGKVREFKLSQTAIDVLALIAYRQPVTLEEILEVRNNASSVLSQLVKRDLITQEKQLVDKKKIVFYKTTERFLKIFNLESIDDLPIVGDIDYR